VNDFVEMSKTQPLIDNIQDVLFGEYLKARIEYCDQVWFLWREMIGIL
jgi:hypothetical protein